MANRRNAKGPHRVGDRPGLNMTFRGEMSFSIGDKITVTIVHSGDRSHVNVQAPRDEKIRKIPQEVK